MRNILIVLLLAVGMSVPFVSSASAYCRCECYWSHGRKVCQQVCSYPQPRSTPNYNYVPTYPYQSSGLDIDPAAIAAIALVALICAGIAAAIAGSSSNASLNRQIEAINASTASMHAEADADAHHTAAIYDDIERQEHAAFLEGRANAEREWDRNHRR